VNTLEAIRAHGRRQANPFFRLLITTVGRSRLDQSRSVRCQRDAGRTQLGTRRWRDALSTRRHQRTYEARTRPSAARDWRRPATLPK